jgi:hypothetical protein
MQISVDTGGKIDRASPERPKSGEIASQLADEPAYRVVGKAMNKVERWASDDVINPGRFSDTRQVRFRLFRWPNENADGLLAILQYDFPDANPAMSCPSIGLLVHLVRNAADWEPRDKYLLETVHHYSILGIEMRILLVTAWMNW